MTTPEGKVKEKVSRVLKLYDTAYGLYYFMPVQFGMGATTLDYLCCFYGIFFAIETKAGKGKLTDRQKFVRIWIERCGGRVFEIRDDDGIRNLATWLESIVSLNKENS